MELDIIFETDFIIKKGESLPKNGVKLISSVVVVRVFFTSVCPFLSGSWVPPKLYFIGAVELADRRNIKLTSLALWCSCRWHNIGDRQILDSRFPVDIGYNRDFGFESSDFACFYKLQSACIPCRFVWMDDHHVSHGSPRSNSQHDP